jgi:uncharacterized membrane protein HdeD (DUF308 family)
LKKVLALRAAISFGVGIFITFNQSHSAATGLLALGIFGIGYAILNGIGSAVWERGSFSLENLPLTLGALTFGAAALFVPTGDLQFAALVFVFLIGGGGLMAGAFELYLAQRAGFATRSGKDSLISAVLSLVLGLLFLILPLDIVSAVGFFGAYLVISGVHLGIAAGTPAK